MSNESYLPWLKPSIVQLEKRVREHAGDTEPAWDDAGKETGLQIWRIEQFKVVDWPKERYGSFYDGDSYILMNVGGFAMVRLGFRDC